MSRVAGPTQAHLEPGGKTRRRRRNLHREPYRRDLFKAAAQTEQGDVKVQSGQRLSPCDHFHTGQLAQQRVEARLHLEDDMRARLEQ